MDKQEILINSIWVEGKLKVYSQFFDKEVLLYLYPSQKTLRATEQGLSDKMVETVNDFLNLSADAQPIMERLLYQHCIDCCEETSYGVDVDIEGGESETEANLRVFGIGSQADAFATARLSHITIMDDPLRQNRFVRIIFYPPWEIEHGCELLLKNGELLNYYGESGTYLGQFDD